MKKILTLTLLLGFVAFADTPYDISTGNLEIVSGGQYSVTGSTTEHDISIDTPDPVTITLDNVSIDLSTESPINIIQGNVTLILSGSNTLKQSGGKIGPPIHVPPGTSVTIEGNGSLLAKSDDNWSSAIGAGDNEHSGTIIINSGTIEARGGYYSGGIGGGSDGSGTVVINGGVIKAYSGNFGAAIGGGGGWKGFGVVSITGGTIFADGKANGAGIGNGDEGGHNSIGSVTITGGTIEAKGSGGAGIGAGKGNTNGLSGRAPQIYISGGSIKASSEYGDPIGKGQAGVEHGDACPTPLTEEGGEPIYKATVSSAIIDHGRNYTFTTTRDNSPYTYSYSGKGYLNNGVFSAVDDNLYFYLPNGDYVADGGWARFAGTVDNADAFLSKTLIGTAYLYIDNGAVTFTSTGVSGKDEDGNDVEGEYAEYVISGSGSETTNTIDVQSGTHNITLNGVNISGSPAFNVASSANVTVNLTGSNNLQSANLAEAARKSPFNVPSGANLTINGPGSLVSRSNDNWGSGIGGGDGQASGTITINSGSITAYGGAYSAGIGGGAGQYGTVTIKGGEVKAYGGNWGAGIGGGTGWNGYANITISGGYIYAEGGQGAGIGNGDEGGHNTLGTITITGGTVEAKSGSGAGVGAGRGNTNGLSGRVPHIYISGGTVKGTSNEGDPIGKGWAAKTQGDPSIDPLTEPSGEVIYSATLPDAMVPPNGENFLIASASEEVDFTTKRDGEDYSYAYSGVGYASDDSLYFYLPDGTYVISGSNGKSFGGTIDGEDATFVVVPEPAVLGLAMLALAAFLRRK